MELRKEPAVFAVALLALGGLVWSSVTADVRRSTSKKAEAPPEVGLTVPDVAQALPRARSSGGNPRDLFSPPSDTRPLPPLAYEPPPRPPLPALLAPVVPGPERALWGRFLRRAPRTVEVPDLFAAEPVAEEPAVEAPQGLSGRATAPTPEEQAARIAGWKRTYDWYRVVEYRFGQIKNPDRYRLHARPDEDLLFVEFGPERGAPRFPGQAPVKIPRRNITEFAFAENVPTQIELRRIAFGDPLSAAEYDQALAFAAWCLDQRLETPRALDVASEIYRRAAAVLQEDPLPRLGLARVHEAAFRFEDAFQIYRGLLDGPMRNNPLVLVRLAELAQRFHLHAEAERNLREAERYGRTQWMVQEALGRHLLARGRAAEAVVHLRLANQFEPQDAEEKRERGHLRALLGAALLGAGELEEGAQWFDKALQADPACEEAFAGQCAVRTLGGTAVSPVPAETRSFDLVLAAGLELARKSDAESARRGRRALELAAQIDPLRASLALRGLSGLAEATGHPDEAQRYAELALENDPTDVWAHFQRGRLAALKDDLEGATESLRAALERDPEFADALAWLGDVAHTRGDLATADRYLERAVRVDPTLIPAQVLRGTALLEAGVVQDAEEALRQAVAAASDDPVARAGLAWCYYLRGDATEALTRLGELDDARRALPEEDPWRVWSRRQIERLTDHLDKVVWTDGFERIDLSNGWSVQEAHGPLVSIHDGVVTIGGTFKSAGRSRLWQLKNAGDFVVLEARLTVRAGTTARVGLFVSRETVRGGETTVEAEATISRHPDASKNAVQARIMKRGEEELSYTEAPGFEWRLDRPVLLRIERVGDKSDTRVRCSLDGIPVMAETPAPALARTTNDLRIGIFAEGQPGRSVQVDVSEVEIVFRQKNR